jgi:hypothetical protein
MNRTIVGICCLLLSALVFAETPLTGPKLQRVITPATPVTGAAAPLPTVSPAISNVCPNVCEKNMMLTRKLEGTQCVAQTSSSCFPYSCTYDGKLCNTMCANDSACQAGAHCDNGMCIAGSNLQRSCKNDAVFIQRRSGSGMIQAVHPEEVIPCFPYRCDAANSRCLLECQNNSACASGAVCNPQLKQCVPLSYSCASEYRSSNIISADGKLTSCSPYQCKGGVCTSICSVADDCAVGNICDNGICHP